MESDKFIAAAEAAGFSHQSSRGPAFGEVGGWVAFERGPNADSALPQNQIGFGRFAHCHLWLRVMLRAGAGWHLASRCCVTLQHACCDGLVLGPLATCMACIARLPSNSSASPYSCSTSLWPPHSPNSQALRDNRRRTQFPSQHSPRVTLHLPPLPCVILQAFRDNHRIQFQDEALADHLWKATGLKALLEGQLEDRDGVAVGLNPNIRWVKGCKAGFRG